jgi:hypothetical protein
VATHFLVLVPREVEAGVPTPVLVEALSASNQLVPNYTGTVQLMSSDTAATLAGATLPATFTFTGSDDGVHVFVVDFATTGSQSITVTDTTNSSLTGTATTMVHTPPPFPFFYPGFFSEGPGANGQQSQNGPGRWS